MSAIKEHLFFGRVEYRKEGPVHHVFRNMWVCCFKQQGNDSWICFSLVVWNQNDVVTLQPVVKKAPIIRKYFNFFNHLSDYMIKHLYWGEEQISSKNIASAYCKTQKHLGLAIQADQVLDTLNSTTIWTTSMQVEPYLEYLIPIKHLNQFSMTVIAKQLTYEGTNIKKKKIGFIITPTLSSLYPSYPKYMNNLLTCIYKYKLSCLTTNT